MFNFKQVIGGHLSVLLTFQTAASYILHHLHIYWFLKFLISTLFFFIGTQNCLVNSEFDYFVLITSILATHLC